MPIKRINSYHHLSNSNLRMQSKEEASPLQKLDNLRRTKSVNFLIRQKTFVEIVASDEVS